jgi:hypothetical protein
MKSYCGNESARKRIVERGHKRCTDGEYACVHRLKIARDTISRS